MDRSPSQSTYTSDTDVHFLRHAIRDLMEKQEYKSALFWSDKVVCLSEGMTSDVLSQARCLYHLREYHRAVHLIKSRRLHEVNLACRHLVAKCHFAAKELKEAFNTISEFETEEDFVPGERIAEETGGQTSKTDLSTNRIPKMDTSNLTTTQDRINGDERKETPMTQEEELKWKSSLVLLKGLIYEATDNRSIAAECFKQALKINPFNYEAFSCLTQHQMLTREEEEAVLNQITTLAPSSSSIPLDLSLTQFLYGSMLKKYACPADALVTNLYNDKLYNNVDLLTAKAEGLYYNCQYYQCLKITTDVLTRDMYHTSCLPIHISCLMELKKTVQLFALAHKLVDLYPESATSWHAVGCYYLMINKTDAARRYLNKALTLDPVFGPSWLLYGHSFAQESEHDQAMAAYFKASHLMKGCHLPLLYIGLEYGVTDNTKLAEKFFNQALSIAPKDPFVLHELGVISFQNQDMESADNYFTQALQIIRFKKEITRLPDKWEPLLNNLGHVNRKLKRYEEALDYHRQALMLSPSNSSTFSAIGYIYALMSSWSQAVEYFHKALGLKRDDPFSSNLLNQCIEHLITSMTPLNDPPPVYEEIKSSKRSRSSILDNAVALAEYNREDSSVVMTGLPDDEEGGEEITNEDDAQEDVDPFAPVNDIDMDIEGE